MTPTDIRLKLRASGYDPIPAEGKVPPMEKWQEKFDTTDDEIRLWPKTWHLAHNTGCLARRTPGADLDITDEDAAEALAHLAREHFEERGTVTARIGQWPKRLIPLRTDEPFAKMTRAFRAPDGTQHKIEVLCDGQHWVAFGEHPTAKVPYRWTHGEPGVDIARAELPYVRREDMEQFLDAAETLLIEQHGFTLVTGLAQGDGELRMPGSEPLAPTSRVAAAVAVIPNGDLQWDDWNRVGMAIWAATNGSAEGFEAFDKWSQKARKYDARETSRKWSGYVRSPPTRIGFGTLKYLADQADPTWQEALCEEPPQGEPEGPRLSPDEPPPPTWVFDPWERYIVPPFPLDVLPADVGDFISNQAAIVGGDMSAMAMSTLATLSGALDHRYALRMMRNGDWWASPRLWVLLVGAASLRKTPIIRTATRPLVAQDSRVQQQYQARLREWEEAKEAKEEQGERTKLPKPQPPKRYVVGDTTVEKLGEILARHPKGILVKADELAGWIASMERYSSNAGASDRAFWLQAFDGGPYTIDRIKRGEIFVENLSVSIVGGIQPARLAELHKLSTDGLLQRFLPVMMGAAAMPEDRAYRNDGYDNLVREMYIAPPAHLIMTDGAIVRMEIIRKGLFNLEQAAAGSAPGLESFVGKLHGVCGSLALILHMVVNPRQAMADPVDETTIERVERLVWGFILPHAYEFYRFSSAGDQLRGIASWILTSNLTRIVSSDLTRNVAGLRGLSVFDVNQRVSPLVAGGWLHPEDKTPVCRAWHVAPQVRQQLADRALVEGANKAELRRLMGSTRK
jgi:hypothetical protein